MQTMVENFADGISACLENRRYPFLPAAATSHYNNTAYPH